MPSSNSNFTKKYMEQIESFDVTPLIDEKEIAARHIKLVEGLTKSLLIGQIGFLQAGKFLYEIKLGETYKFEDANHLHTFKDFCERPDISIPGRTAESRKRTAYTLIKIYEQLQLKLGLEEKDLATIGWTKLGILATVAERNPDDFDKEDWLNKAESLTYRDLELEAATDGKTIADIQDCVHTNMKQVTKWHCLDCKNNFAEDPR